MEKVNEGNERFAKMGTPALKSNHSGKNYMK